MNILILDDEAETRNRIARLLSREGNVYQGGNGSEGLEIIDNHDIDLILTDICMPVMDGLELIRTLRGRDDDVEIIVMSGYSDFDYAQRAIRYGVMDYLLKPISPVDLLNLVKKASKQREKLEYSKQFGMQPFLNALFNGDYGRREAEEKMDLLSMDTNFDYCLSGYARLKGKAENGIEMERLSRLIPEYAPKGMKVYVFQRGRSAALFITVKDITRTYIEKALKEFSLKASASPELETSGDFLWMGFSSPAFSVTDLREKDREADTLRRTTLFDSHFECCLPVPSADRSKILEETDMLSDRILSIVISDIEPIRFVSEYFRHLSYTARMYDYPTAEDRIAVLLGRLIRISEKNIISDKHLRIEADIRECRKLGNLYDTAQSLIGIIKHIQEEYRRENIPLSDVLTGTIRRRVQENIANESFSIQDAIKGLNYSENYIRYIFTNSEGMTIKEYITSERMKHASALLEEGKAVKDVAESSGFSNQRYFSKCFKDFFGMTPTEYRESKTGK